MLCSLAEHKEDTSKAGLVGVLDGSISVISSMEIIKIGITKCIIQERKKDCKGRKQNPKISFHKLGYQDGGCVFAWFCLY